MAAHTLIQVRSREEALEWGRRFPNLAGNERERTFLLERADSVR